MIGSSLILKLGRFVSLFTVCMLLSIHLSMRGLNVALRYYSRSFLDFYKPVNLPEHIGLHEIRMVIQEGFHLSFSQGSLPNIWIKVMLPPDCKY